MAERIPEVLQKKLSDRLSFYDDLGIRFFYKDRCSTGGSIAALPALQQNSLKDTTLPKSARKPEPMKLPPSALRAAPKGEALPKVTGPSLFEAV